MDGIHDVGGREGFGPITVTHEDTPFPTEWEGRAFGISKSMRSASDYSTDKFRYTREQLPPLEYLTSEYFGQWLRAGLSMLVGSGLVTLKELADGRSHVTPDPDSPSPTSAERARAATTTSNRYDGPYEGTPKYAVGDTVTVSTQSPLGHTRLPQYARGRTGKIICFHGAHGVPDDNVRNIQTFEPLYTVAFTLGELFEEHAGSSDMINLEIWERFLDQT